MAKPAYLALASLPPAERAKALRDPAVKARIMSEANVAPEHPGSMEALIPNVPFPMHQTFPLETASSYEPLAEESFEARAQAAGLSDGRSALYDHLVGGEGRERLPQIVRALERVGVCDGAGWACGLGLSPIVSSSFFPSGLDEKSTRCDLTSFSSRSDRKSVV